MSGRKTNINDYKDRMSSPVGAIRTDPVTREPLPPMEPYEPEECKPEIPENVVSRSIEWLKAHGHSDAEITDFLQYWSK